MPSPSIESNSNDLQSSNSSVSENEESSSSILSKPVITFVKAVDSPTVIKTNKDETVRKSSVKYVELYRKTSKSSNAPKALMVIDEVGWDWIYMANKEDDHALVADQEAPTEFVLMAKSSSENEDTVLFPLLAQVYSPSKRDMSWTGLPEFAVNTITDYSRPSPSIETDSPTVVKTNKNETVRKSFVKYAEIKFPTGNSKLSTADLGNKGKVGNSQNVIDDKGYWDSGCSWHITGNISYLSEYEPYDGGYVSFRQGGGKITGKGIIKTDKLEFENVYFVKDLKYNLFSVSQICDNKNSVLFTYSECIVLGRYFRLKDDTNVFLRTPRKHNMYSIDLNNIVPHKDLTCLVAKAFADESVLWHMRLGDLNFKTMNKLVRHNLVRGLPSKCFENDHTCVACLKGKQHKASCKTKLVHSVSKPLHTLHMGLFRPTSVSSLNHKWCDNGGEFRNKEMNDFYSRKGIKREFSNARTPQQNGVAERRNKTLIEAARTMLAHDKLPVTFWAEAVNTTCTKDAASQDVKKDVSSLRYIAFPNWFHEAHLESSTSTAQDACNVDAPESSGNSNPTATSTNPLADHMETLTVESQIPTVSSHVLTACLDDSPEPSSDTRLILKRVTSQDDTPSLDNILNLSNRFEDILRVTINTGDTNGVEANLGNMENNISASPTPTFRIHKDHPKSQIIGLVDTPVQTRTKSKEMEEQKEPKKNFDALKDPSWVEAMQEELLQFKIQNVYSLVDCPKGDPEFLARVYNVEKAMRAIDQTLFIRKHRGDFILVQVYVDDIIFGSSNPLLCREFEALMHEKFQMSAMDVRSANTSMNKENPWGKDETGKEVDIHLYRSMIGSLMYLTASRLEIMFAVCACARHQVTPKECHLHAVKRIFRYLKGHPKLGLWYPKESPFDFVAYSDSNYGGATQDWKSTTEGSASGYGQVLWIQNQLLDYGHHFIRDCFEKKLISVDHIHTDDNVADLLTKPFDAGRFQYLVFWSTARIETTDEGTKILATVDDEPVSPLGDDSQGEAFPTVSGLEAEQDRENIIKTFALPHDSPPRVTSLTADESKITSLKARIKLQEDKDRGGAEPSGEDAIIKGRSLETEEEASVEKSTERGSNDTEELVNVLTSLDAASILTSKVQVVSVPPAAEVATISVPTGSGLVPTASQIFTTASVVTPYSRCKGKEKLVESDTPKKKNLQEQIDVQMAREMEEQLAREDQIMNEQIARDVEIARIHAEEELQMLIDGLDKQNTLRG
nr:hypothetical protein [Tanacetum cinerariifolium]